MSISPLRTSGLLISRCRKSVFLHSSKSEIPNSKPYQWSTTLYDPDPGDQILLKIQSARNHFKSKERRPHHHEPNATRLGSNGRRMREISRSVQNDKQAKKNVLTVQSVRMLTWQAVRHVAGSYDTWQVLVGRIVDELAFDTCH
jgi:hypothetical protein